jgi:hypothetical protein
MFLYIYNVKLCLDANILQSVIFTDTTDIFIIAVTFLAFRFVKKNYGC